MRNGADTYKERAPGIGCRGQNCDTDKPPQKGLCHDFGGAGQHRDTDKQLQKRYFKHHFSSHSRLCYEELCTECVLTGPQGGQRHRSITNHLHGFLNC